MPNDRAAVAREVLTELEQHFRDDPLQGLGATAATVVKWFRDEHYPAPPAPETVTVGDDVYSRRGDTWYVGGFNIGLTLRHRELLDRIASDARVIAERDARIAELERERDDMSQRHTDVCEKWSDENRRRVRLTERIAAQEARIAELETQLQRALDGAVFHEKRAHHAEQERDAARARIAELEQLLQDQPRLLYDSMWQAIDRMGDAVGTLTGPGSNCHVTATRVCETIETLKSERDAALRALEEKGAGTLPKGASASEESQAAGSLREAPTSPAPIPLGATIEVDGVKWARTELGWSGGAWRYRDSSTVARVLTALYRARHPVATRETVERVALAVRDADLSRSYLVPMHVYHKLARAALTAAGFTLEEGA